jgi:dihydropteroate synthase
MIAADLGGVLSGAGYPVRIVAVLNVSPESFYSGSVSLDATALREAAHQAVADGADLLDIGAMTTAPYLRGAISVDEERRRLATALEIVAPSVAVPVSADTQRAAVARAALAAGATIVNDVSGLRGDPEMGEVAAQARGLIVAASELGAADVGGAPLAVVHRLLEESVQRARTAGVDLRRVVLDPGIGFFTHAEVTPAQFSCAILAGLRSFDDLGHPLLVGVSRKSFVGTLTGRSDPADRLWGSLAATAIAVYNGAALIRTHDVAATRDAIRIAAALRDQGV